MDKAKTKNILEDSKKIDVMSLIEHSTIFSPEGNYLMGKKRKGKRNGGLDLIRPYKALQRRITCEFIELLVHFENQYEKSNYEFVNLHML